MLIQLDWLKQYVDWELPTEELADVLSMGGLEVEAMEEVKLPGGKTTQVMELNVTPNRGYCLSYIGVAREVAALLGTRLRISSANEELEKVWGPTPVQDRIAVENREEVLCPRYSALVIENVRPGPSPGWLHERLIAMGLRPINNIVDITNFVMMEYGQPLHAFDRELLAGPKIVIRRAQNGEAFTSLDESKLTLAEDALVIADAEKPVALAGIMGGTDSQVSESTRNVVLESACFDPVTVRKGSRKYNLRSDSSFRFERGIDIEAVIAAQSRAALLMRELAGGEICRGRIDLYPNPLPTRSITLRGSRVNKILGVDMSSEKIAAYLERLGLNVVTKSAAADFQVEIPHFRPMLTREIDVIEEIARIDGFEKVEEVYPPARISPVRPTREQAAVATVRETLCHLGYSEVINYSFIENENSGEYRSAFGTQKTQTVPLDNPLSVDGATMRTSLIPGLLKTAARNLSKGQKPVKIFEVGHVFLKDGDSGELQEKNIFSALVTGAYEKNVWKPQNRHYDFYDLKGALETVVAQFKLSLQHRPADRPFLLRGRSVEWLNEGCVIGFLGELSPARARKWDLGDKVLIFEMDLQALVAAIPARPRFSIIPKYPETFRDISILVDRSIPSQAISDLIMETGAPLITRADLYDHFEGKKIEKGKKSLTLSLVFQSDDKTLTDNEVNPLFDKIVRTLADKHGATLRE